MIVSATNFGPQLGTKVEQSGRLPLMELLGRAFLLLAHTVYLREVAQGERRPQTSARVRPQAGGE
jgi:hypothetical protein